jgi:hypothetical protein
MNPGTRSTNARLEIYEDYFALGNSLKLAYEQEVNDLLIISRTFGKTKEVSRAAEEVVIANHNLRNLLDAKVASLFPDRFTGHEFFGPSEGRRRIQRRGP